MIRPLFALALLSTSAPAELPTGSKSLWLQSATEKIEVGSVEFAGNGSNRNITVHMSETLFKDHFLSMRPFKCLEGKKFYCYLPYPYEWKGVISENDLTDLEYALLFVQKDPTAYGINLWNGIYYKLELAGDGRISGALHEVDMDTLASPPEAGELRPITPDLLNRADPGGQWLPTLVIE
jgi:hypothetical protein